MFVSSVKGSRRKNWKKEQLVRAISIIDYAYGGLFLLLAILLLIGGTILTLGGSFVGIALLGNLQAMTTTLVGGAIIILAMFIAALGVLYIYLGKAIGKRKYWAKITQIVVAIIVHLFSPPVGTIIALFELYVLVINQETKDIFK